ncbi:MAG: AMP-binding protein [Gammaproteobacteria bacterium]|nr:AMP-binding protein [Gammaproteobacteria bacterium]
MALVDPRPEQDLAAVLARRVAHCPRKPWIVTARKSWSYEEIETRSGLLARGMTGLGIRAGDTVLVMLPDIADYVVVWCALSKFGGVEVPVNVHYRGNLLAYLVNDSLAETILIDDRFLSRLEDVQDDLKQLKRVVVYSDAGNYGPGLADRLSRNFEILSYPDLVAETGYDGPGPAYNDLMGVLYTSGTTGPSKGVTMTHAHAYEYARGVTEMLELDENDIYGVHLPLFHIAGQFATVYASCIAGATAVLATAFSPGRYWEEIRTYRITCTFLLGAMANFLYRQPRTERDFDNPLDRVLMVPLIPEVEDFRKRYGCRVSTTWGGTEMNCPTRSGFDLADNRSCGRVLEDRYEVRIVDSMDEEVPDGTPGEALVRTKIPWITTNGYWNHPEWTAGLFRNQWIHTGDMLARDRDGNLYFVDRIRDAIRRRGENISSMEVENEINTHPAVLECAVVPVDSRDTEQEVMAVVVLRDGEQVEPEALVRHLETRMAYFMVPRYIDIVDTLPKTPTGKIRKFVLREKGVTETTWDRVAAGVALNR